MIGWLAAAGLLLGFAWWRFHFFHRDPPRCVPPGRDPVSPADGKILYLDEIELRPDAADPYHRRVQAAFAVAGGWSVIATYLSIFDVHRVRAPIGGRIGLIPIAPIGDNLSMGGAFLHAALRRPLPIGRRGYTEKNELLGVEIRGDAGEHILLVLMADWWIDQIIALVADGVTVERGQVIGKIQMGSQVDLWAPAGSLTWRCDVGDRVTAGETVIGRGRSG